MDRGLPMFNRLLQHTLRGICSSDFSSNSTKWVYSVFWRILPRNYPPPKWEFGGGATDRAKGNKRNWILAWEDGYCDFCECERAWGGHMRGRFGPEVFFKLSHEVYSYGEGLVGKVAADNSHKWVLRDSQSEPESNNFVSPWNMSIEPQPRVWEAQFNSGIQTIAIIAVKEGVVQLGSFAKTAEDINLVVSIQRKFSYLQSIPGVFSIQRPFLPLPSLFPGVSFELGSMQWKMPSATPLYSPNTDNNRYGQVHVVDVKVEPSCHLDEVEKKLRSKKEGSLNIAD
ncbi:hypothetical protein SAY86_010734 [Trapa natans]|uniref:Transcription factor MYC/MYB N-terminal domain-containing protein n=1 Tax=Trapa natans TaxID=22666 RepID=A0AAN7R4H2_TRANT|nr:hypothetical protein SAY86_010734 [Trapa natans]